MNKLALLTLVSFLGLACVPLVAAQDGNMLTDGISWITDGASNLWNQASTFATENPLPTGAAVTGVAGTGVCAWGWNKTKGKLQSTVKAFTEKLSGAESQASAATEQLTAYKSKVESQLAGVQTEAQKQIEAAKSATGQLSILTDKVAEKDGIIGSLRNQVAEKEEQYKKLLASYEERCKITAVK